MASTLSYGFVKPATGDRGSVFFPALENAIQQLNDHTHNGVNSAFIPAASISRPTSSVSAASILAGADGVGNYTVRVTVPAAISGAATYNDNYYYTMTVKVATAGTEYGDVLYPTIERFDSDEFDLTVNDASNALIIIYN